jgi:hypothetical protein
MPVTRQPVESSYCAAIGHDASADELHVEWKNGRVSVYHPVTPEEHQAVITAPSVGKAVIQIKKVKQHHYL